MRQDFVMRDMRHTFPPPERVRLAEDLSHEMITLHQLETEFDKLKTAHTAKAKERECTIRDLARKLCEGWEYRDIPYRQLWNDPEVGKKTVVRLDTGEVVAVEDMADDERQERLPLEAESEPTLTAVLEKVAEQVNSGALDTPGVTCTASVTPAPDAEYSTEERNRTRKTKPKGRGQDALLPAVPKPDEPPTSEKGFQ